MSLADPKTSFSDSLIFLEGLPGELPLPKHGRDDYNLAFLEWTVENGSAFLFSFSGHARDCEGIFYYCEIIGKQIWKGHHYLNVVSIAKMAGRLAAFFEGKGE